MIWLEVQKSFTVRPYLTASKNRARNEDNNFVHCCLWKCRLMIWWAKYWVLKYFVAVSVYATANHWIFFWLRWYILQCGYDLRKVKELWNDFEYVCKIQMVKALVLACVVCLSLSTQEHGLCSRVMFQESLINGH